MERRDYSGPRRAALARRARRARPELDLDGLLVLARVDRERDRLAGLLGGDHLGQVGLPLELLAVHGGDDVAARRVPRRLEGLGAVPGLDAGLVGRPAGRDLLHPGALLHREVELLRELREHGHGGDAEVGILGLALLAQLRQRALDGVDRDGETDALAAAARGQDLRVDAEHAALLVEERPARVAVVDGGVGLDRARDAEAAGERVDRAVEARDDAGRERLRLVERGADRGHGLADEEARARAELDGREVEALRIDPDERDVDVRVRADDL